MPNSRIRKSLGLLLIAMIVARLVWWGERSPQAADFADADIWLVEHSSDIFIGKIDIITASDTEAIEYTVITTEILKGDLAAQSLVVVRQELAESGESVSLVPGEEYLLFGKYEPTTLRYVLIANELGEPIIEDADPPTAESTYWQLIVERYTCAVTDVLVLDGAVYGRRDWTAEQAHLSRAQIGASIANIEVIDTSATGCRSDLANGTASNIAAGIEVHELKEFAPSFRVAVKVADDRWDLYEVLWSTKATTGADLYDIRDRVMQIKIEPSLKSFECDDTSVCLAPAPQVISDSTDLIRLTDLILAAPVDSGDIRYYRIGEPASGAIIVLLDDGSTILIEFNPESGRLANGLTLPPEILDLMPNYQ